MEFGKVSNPDVVDFSMPADHHRNAKILSGVQTLSRRLYVGCPIWNQDEWKGKWYPEKTAKKRYLEEYAKQFNTIELNATHYRIPEKTTVRRWVESAAEGRKGFTFCPKIYNGISHYKQLNGVRALTDIFSESALGFGRYLGPAFLQLPPNFSSRQSERLVRFLSDFPAEIPLAVEFRHPSWFDERDTLAQAVFDAMETLGIGTVITDVSGRRDVLHMRLTNRVAVIRFVGNGLHPTDYTRADAWIERLLSWFETGLEQLQFWVHEPDNVHAPEMADYFIKNLRLKMKTGLSEQVLKSFELLPERPKPYIKPQQQSLF